MKRVQDNRRRDRQAKVDDARSVLVCILKAGEVCEGAGSAVYRLEVQGFNEFGTLFRQGSD